jgi:hypothetical protein
MFYNITGDKISVKLCMYQINWSVVPLVFEFDQEQENTELLL